MTKAQQESTIRSLVGRVAGEGVGAVPRMLVVLAHPDDEVLALGGRLERWRDALFLCVTDGAPADGADARDHGFANLDAYRQARRSELDAALAHAGLSPTQARTLSVGNDGTPMPDQQVTFALPAVTRAVLKALQTFKPEVVLTHPYEGGHPDHDACAFAVHTAVALLEGDPHRSSARPLLLEAPSYHAGPHGMVTGRFLPWLGSQTPSSERAESSYTSQYEPVVAVLREQERAAKRARLACFASQRETLSQFRCDTELFRVAPPYRFSEPPHSGQLLYERFPWGMTGQRFRAFAQAAEAELCPRGGKR